MFSMVSAVDAVVTTRGEEWALKELWAYIEKFHPMFWAHEVPDRLLWDAYEEVVGYKPVGYDRVKIATELKETLRKKLGK